MPRKDVHQCQCPHCLGLGHPPDQPIHRQMNLLLSRLEEQQRRWYAAVASAKLGHGGDRFLCLGTGLHVDTIRRGREELAAALDDRPADRGRLPGGGRPALFVRRRLPALGTELGSHGDSAGPTTGARRLRTQHDSPRINFPRFTGPDHPDRDRQFVTLQDGIGLCEEAGLPIISVAGKKKELIGNFTNSGAVGCDEPEEGNVSDFLSEAECRATPYGSYDLLSGRGHICVGTSSDTPAFAVEAIRTWWARYGCKPYRGRTSC